MKAGNQQVDREKNLVKVWDSLEIALSVLSSVSDARMRHFVNSMPDFAPGDNVKIDKDFWKQQILSISKSIVDQHPCTPEKCDGGLYVGNAGIAYMFFYLAKNKQFENEKQNFLESAMMYTKVSVDYGKRGGYSRDPTSSFILGVAGSDAVASMVYDCIGDAKSADNFAKQFEHAAQKCKPIDFFRNGSDELFVGRAGYLCGVLSLEKRLGRKIIGEDIVHQLCAVTVESGRKYAQRHRSKSPLMYAYYKTEYLGAAHGLSAILQILLSFPKFLRSDASAEKTVHGAVDFMLSLEQANFNYAPAMDEVDTGTRPPSEELVHWCHGAPGVVYMLARAYLFWRDDKYLQACLRCGELTWQKGLLRKGPGICHGVAGSGYVFLLLYRLTGDPKHLHRAVKFAEFLASPEFQQGAKTPDSPFSLYEGWAGTVCFLSDLLQPDTAEFPFFDVFVD